NRTVAICDYIQKLGSDPKKFIQNLLDSTKPEIIKKRQFWGTSRGWSSTEKILLSIKRRILDGSDQTGLERWNNFILREAKVIVNKEELPRGTGLQGAFYSANKIDESFLTPQSEENRATLIRESMPFLHALIYSKIEESNKAREKVR
ncbi:hypothetical protein DFH28DRAFT_865743, partial [Melampsora americana]